MTSVETNNISGRVPGPSFGEAFKTWFKIGCISFGGPAGQIAMMHRIVIDEKKWIDEARFLHALNFCMLLPGPEATKLATYIASERGRTFVRSTLRRSRLVEQLVDDWLAAHPEHPPIPHAEDAEESGVSGAEAAAAVDVTDPGSILTEEPATT